MHGVPEQVNPGSTVRSVHRRLADNMHRLASPISRVGGIRILISEGAPKVKWRQDLRDHARVPPIGQIEHFPSFI